MSAAAAPAYLDPLAGVAGALNGFRARLGAAAGSLQGIRRAVGGAGSAVGRLGGGAASAGTALRQVKARAEGAGQSLTKAGRTAGRTATQVRSGGGKGRGAAGPLASIASEGASVGALAGVLGKGSGTVSRLMGFFGGALTVAAGAMTAVNVAMRANPLGFVIGLVAPLAGLLIDYALNSETGRKIVKQVFDQVLKVFRGIWTFIGPVVRGYLTVISLYFTAVRAIITGVLKVVGAVVSRGFDGARATVTTATRAVTGLIRRAWNGVKAVVKPVLTWITTTIPDMFQRVKDAMSRTLHAIGDFVSTGLQAVTGAITGAVNGLIAFANRLIDGLNSLSFSFLGKEFGVDLPKIPQLADGGLVRPATGGATGAVQPLSALERLRPAERGHTPSYGAVSADRGRLGSYREPEGRSALAVAEDLLFLHRTAA
ncbi:tape-measure protein [Streptomyces sp. NPDC047928]|uniref:tape-measure protein n=1 Tax=unclassified Streptomyces TaxID=2593676 RepID=UPI00371622E3